MSERRVLVLGGGISGLATAEALTRHASKAGQPVRAIVLEAGRRPGGKIKTRRENGFVVESGPHGFLDKEPKMFELIERLGLGDQVVAANTAAAKRFIFRAGKLREVPMSPPAFLTSDVLSWTGKLRCALEPFMPGPRKDEESVREFAARRIGTQAADVMVDAMVTGIYGGDPSSLSLKAAFPRMHELESTYGSLVKAQVAIARDRKRLPADARVGAGQATGAPSGVLHSFKDGLSTLIDALADRVDVQCGSVARRIEKRDGGWRVRVGNEWLSADAVVSTLPAYATAELIRSLDAGAADEIDGIPYVPCSVVVQCYRKSDVGRSTEGFGFLVPGGAGRQVLGSIWASTVFPDHGPRDQVMFRSMLGGARRPELANASEAELAALARGELVDLMGVRPEAEPTYEAVIPWSRAIPQYNLGHAKRVAAADDLCDRNPGLFLSGNAFRGVAVLACVAEADRVGGDVARYLSTLPEETTPLPSPRVEVTAPSRPASTSSTAEV